MKLGAFAVLTAAGSGTRLGGVGPKALVEVGGVPMLVRAARGLATAGIDGIVVTAPPERIDDFSALFPSGRLNAKKNKEGEDQEGESTPVIVVAGSAVSRQASVARGLTAVPQLAALIGFSLTQTTPVLVHDAARCLTPPSVIRRVVEAVRSGFEAVIPAVGVTDTLKELGAPIEGTNVRSVRSTPDRSRLVAVQTPQGFAWETLRIAHEKAAERAGDEAIAATDDASLVEVLGGRVGVVAGDALSLKVTTTVDLALAELLLANSGHLEPQVTISSPSGERCCHQGVLGST